MKKIAMIILSAAMFCACSKKTETPKDPDPIPVKITNWSVSNQWNQSRWNVNVDIDKPLEEEVIITCTFTSWPEQTKVTVPITLPKGWVSWYGISTDKPGTINSGMLSNSISFTIKGSKKYTLTF